MRRGGKCISAIMPKPAGIVTASITSVVIACFTWPLHCAGKPSEAPGETMTPLELLQSRKMPFAELKGVVFIEAEKDRVVAKMLVRPDLCTQHNTIHGGAV